MSWFRGDRSVELAYLNCLLRNQMKMRVEISKLHTELRDLRAERKEPVAEPTHYPPPAPRPDHAKVWWGVPWKTSLG